MYRSYFHILLIILLASCSGYSGKVTVITITGSSTMYQLTEQLAAEYMMLNPNVSIYVSGSSTAAGIKALINNETDICTASRTLQPNEAKMLSDYYQTVGMFYLIAKDALTIYVNKENPVDNLTVLQIRDIYTGKIKNWKEVGGEDFEILPIIRVPNSGTHIYFKEHVLAGLDYTEAAQAEATIQDVIEEVSTIENAIGYGGIMKNPDVKMIKIKGITPSEENVRNDKYPLTRYLHFFTTNTPKGEVKKFIDWTLTPAGQKVIEKSDFISLFSVSY